MGDDIAVQPLPIKINITITPHDDDQSVLDIATEGIKLADLPEAFDWVLHNLRYANKRKMKRIK